ncbi:hypothetical protein AAY473_000100 [Plecturocebus cupreus]
MGSPTRARARRARSSCESPARLPRTRPARKGGTGTPQSLVPCTPRASASPLGPGKARAQGTAPGRRLRNGPKMPPRLSGPSCRTRSGGGCREAAAGHKIGGSRASDPPSSGPSGSPTSPRREPRDSTSCGPGRRLTGTPPSRKLPPPLPLLPEPPGPSASARRPSAPPGPSAAVHSPRRHPPLRWLSLCVAPVPGRPKALAQPAESRAWARD